MDTDKKLYCACCGKEIGDTTYDATSERGYYKVLDNYLQIKYFDSDEDNIFCSEECVLKSLSVEFIYLEDKKREVSKVAAARKSKKSRFLEAAA